MTAQVPERLLYRGRMLDLCDQPLYSWFRLSGQEETPFVSTFSANWRGYVGTWEIRDDRLYLVTLMGLLKSGERGSLEDLFPDYPQRVFAHWYSGELRAPLGRLLKYVHMGYASEYERDLLLLVRRGVVLKTRVRENGRAEGTGGGEGYQVAGTTVFSRPGSTGPRQE